MDTLLGLVPFIVILAICPLMMFLMMRMMHRGPTGHEGHVCPLNQEGVADDTVRLQALEAEVAMLRGQLTADAGDPLPAAAEAMTKQPVQQAWRRSSPAATGPRETTPEDEDEAHETTRQRASRRGRTSTAA